MSRHRIL